MLYADHRLSQALSDIRLEQARNTNRRRHAAEARRSRLSRRLGHLLISMGERLADTQARAA